MNNDLISRSALLAFMREVCDRAEAYGVSANYMEAYKSAMRDVEIAPAVKVEACDA